MNVWKIGKTCWSHVSIYSQINRHCFRKESDCQTLSFFEKANCNKKTNSNTDAPYGALTFRNQEMPVTKIKQNTSI